MALNRSQAACEAMAGTETASIVAATIALVDGGGGADTLTDSGNAFVSSGFAVGDLIEVHNATDSNDDGTYVATAVAAGTITIPTGSWTTGEAAGATITVKATKRGSFRELFYNCQLDIYSGSQPSNADAAENGTKLISFTGIMFGDVVWDATELEAYIDLFTGLSITANAAASGTAAWFRLRGGQAVTEGASSTMIRLDGTVGVGTGDLQVASTTITNGAPQTLSSFKIKVPQSA